MVIQLITSRAPQPNEFFQPRHPRIHFPPRLLSQRRNSHLTYQERSLHFIVEFLGLPPKHRNRNPAAGGRQTCHQSENRDADPSPVHLPPVPSQERSQSVSRPTGPGFADGRNGRQALCSSLDTPAQFAPPPTSLPLPAPGATHTLPPPPAAAPGQWTVRTTTICSIWLSWGRVGRRRRCVKNRGLFRNKTEVSKSEDIAAGDDEAELTLG